MAMNTAEKKLSQRARLAKAGGRTLTVELGPDANAALARATAGQRSRDQTVTAREVVETALIHYAKTFPAMRQRAALLKGSK